MSSKGTFDVTQARKAFPALAKVTDDGMIFADNAGGTQVLGSVVERITDYMLHRNVQMGNYKLAQAAEASVDEGYRAAAVFADAQVDDIMFGSSATQLTETLTRMIETTILDRRAGTAPGEAWKKGDEIVITEADHEANRGAWIRLAARLSMTIKTWKVDASTASLTIEGLEAALSARTRLVAFTACSNVLGSQVDVKRAVASVKAKCGEKAWTVVDAVAWAPHGRVHAGTAGGAELAWGADAVVWSWYKVFGPHVGCMYLSPRIRSRDDEGSRSPSATGLISKINHHFLHSHHGTYPYGTTSLQYELIASLPAVVDYLLSYASVSAPTWSSTDLLVTQGASLSASLTQAFDVLATQEGALASAMLAHLASKSNIRIVGEPRGSASRQAIVAFRAEGVKSFEVHAKMVSDGRLSAQQGHVYAPALLEALSVSSDEEGGVVRISLAHYNTLAEVERICTRIDAALSS